MDNVIDNVIDMAGLKECCIDAWAAADLLAESKFICPCGGVLIIVNGVWQSAERKELFGEWARLDQ